jgi:hypothetical protein
VAGPTRFQADRFQNDRFQIDTSGGGDSPPAFVGFLVNMGFLRVVPWVLVAQLLM